MKFFICLLGLVFMVVPIESAAQTGMLYGSVADEKTGDKLPAVSVYMIGTTYGTSTDLDGEYSIEMLPPGRYSVRFMLAGYNSKKIDDIVIEEGREKKLNVRLEALDAAAYRIEDLVVTAERVLSTATAILTERKQSAFIGDAISAEQISMSPDATSGDALKRVTGLSIIDNKYIFVRGVTDRYNATTLNGVPVTSTDTDVDKKSFSFDLIPTSLMSNATIVKTATPDKPGDFSGGLVQISTLDLPAERIFSFGYGMSYNDKTSTRDILASQGGGDDWLGMDDGTRDLPPGDLTGNSLARELPNNWHPRTKRAPLNGSFNVALGDHHYIGTHEIGYVGALTYKNKYQKKEFSENPSYRGVPIFYFDGVRYERDILWGGLLNLNYKPTRHHKLSVKNSYVQSAEEKVSFSAGLPETGEWTKRHTIEWDERNMYLRQFGGEHAFSMLFDTKLTWNLAYSDSKAKEPDRKHVEFEKGTEDWYRLRDNYRTWSELNERSNRFDADLSIPLGGERKLKFGYAKEKRERDFSIDAWSTDPSTVRYPNYPLLILPIETIFSPENYGVNMLTFIPVTVFTGTYDGYHDLRSYFAMADMPFVLIGQRFRVVGGARIEDSEQIVNTVKAVDDPEPFAARNDDRDVLPSVNLTYMLGDFTNLRFAYSHSVNRPEFREMANVLYYDFDRIQNVKGNPNLERALIRNLDVRLEMFPDVNEVLAVSYFYKSLDNAIEEKLIPSPERFLRTWFNSPDGQNKGFEVELRKSFGFITHYLDGFLVTGNYTRVWSEIEYTDAHTDELGNTVVSTETREMQGQSPWTVNLSLLYSNETLGTSVNLLYNKIGRRLDAVGDSRDEDVYEEPRGLFDIALSQRMPFGCKAKFVIQNLSDEDIVFTSGPEKDSHETISTGRTYSFSISYNF
ncbi:MAG TPA: TonB-dependent receptor [Candidatus Eisenbacteria bacterium]|uniref:TonB-dependent receptor n=1 Tax=Eiseniibacteriota bacterium TaxID=2212470 RepID=A0A7V2AU35_UNCEI|nr:TonB-dependent receptor [Candidatus Eisenbacteria bacterium]